MFASLHSLQSWARRSSHSLASCQTHSRSIQALTCSVPNRGLHSRSKKARQALAPCTLRQLTLVICSANCSHINDQQLHTDAIWWQVVSVLITDPNEWPTADGKKGLTSLDKLRRAQSLGKASADVPTNFFLFFGSDVKGHSH